jgi:hypothetical protein
VFQQEWDDLGAEQRRLKEWYSLLKEQTTTEKEKAVVERERLQKMEYLLKQEEVTIGLLDQEAWDLLEKTKKTHAEADALADTCAKLQADLEWCLSDVSLHELAVEGGGRTYRRRRLRAPIILDTRTASSRPTRMTSAPVRPPWRQSRSA